VTISGTTRLYAILGDPIAKVRTPEHFNSVFAERGIDAVMLPVEVATGDFASTVAGMKKVRNLDGIVLTMPHKAAMCAFVDELLPTGRAVGAINVARREKDGRWTGDMFDGRGYTGALARYGITARGKRVHMIGAGGVARAMAFALADEDIDAVSFFDVDSARASALAQHLIKHSGLETSVGGDPAKADIVVNATPLGMKENDPLPCDVARLAPGTVVSDVTTKPEITPFLAAARARGLAVTSGRDMFEAQVRLIGAFLGFDG